MRWVIIGIFALIGFVLAVLATGAMLPVRHTVTRSLTVQRPVAEVWQAITDYERDPSWRPEVTSVTRIGDRDGHPLWEEKYKNGDSMRIVTTLVDAPKRLERKIVDQSAFGGVWVFELSASPDGKSTTVRLTENGEVYNPAFRIIGRFIIGNEATVEKYLTDLATKFGTKPDFAK
ncbi:MAG TPA: SRPBCC family protein [Terriglobales bacterium]|nr:SRPBCC family protein [Terriglobales bacterium]